jgi:hypothetical protein
MEDSNNHLRPGDLNGPEDVESEVNIFDSLCGQVSSYLAQMNECRTIDHEPHLDQSHLEAGSYTEEVDEEDSFTSQTVTGRPRSPLGRFYQTENDLVDTYEDDDFFEEHDGGISTAMTSHCNIDGSSVVGECHANRSRKEEPMGGLDSMLRTVNDVFSYRTQLVRSAPTIHHFDWFGRPVFNRSATSPAESLAIILSKPKVPEFNKSLRISSILHRASQYVDPVVVNLAGTDDNLLHLRGSELRHAATGRVHRYLSAHGWWLDDLQSHQDPDLDLDTGNVDHYVMSNIAVANGFTYGRVRTASDWFQAHNRILKSRSKPRPRRRRPHAYRPSPLSQMWLASDVRLEIKRKPLPENSKHQVTSASENRVRLPAFPSRTSFTDPQMLDSDRDSDVHYTLPYPASRPRSTIREFLRKIRKRIRRKIRKIFNAAFYSISEPNLTIV